MEIHYCWICERNMPYLNEEEWAKIEPHLSGAVKAIKQYREETGCDLKTARRNCKPEVTQFFFEITGFNDIHFDTIHHHRRSDYGIECPICNRLLRTNRAQQCVNCGWSKT